MRNVLRAASTVVAAIAVLGLGATAASAHECYVASRSAQGNASVAAHSAAWEEVSLDTILTVFIELPQPVADCVEAQAADAGLPSSFVFGAKQSPKTGVIAENNPNTNLFGNGKGIDHAEDAYGDALNALIGACFAAQG